MTATDPTAHARAEPLVVRAEALVRAGRLADAREAASVAAACAEREGDPVLLGRAALALSGLWANELRAPDVRGRATGLQRRALRLLPPGHQALRVRLRARIAATRAFYDDGPVDALRDALADARELGDGRAVAECLSLLGHVLLGPTAGDERLAAADEMIAVSAEAGEPVLAVVGLCWRAVNLFLAGDPRAERALATLRERDRARPCLAVTYQRRVLETMTMIRAGHLEEAEREAEQCLALGQTVGDADALAYYGAQLLLIRWLQGRDDELLTLFADLATAPTLDDVDYTFDAAHAALAVRSGQRELAAVLLERLHHLDLAALPRRSTWTAMLMGVIVTAAAVDDRVIAAAAYDLLRPYGHLPIMPSFAVVDFGAGDHFLALAARCLGRFDDAVDHHERALTTNARTGNRPLVCLGRVELAETLAARGADGDERLAVAHYDVAIQEGTTLGLDTLGDRWRARRAELDGLAAVPELSLRPHEHGWVLHHGPVDVALPGMIGLHHLAELLAAPGIEIDAVVLTGGPAAPHERTSGQTLIDPAARDAYRRRVRALTARVADASDCGAEAELRGAQDELDALVAELRTVSRAGRIRRFAGPDERARTAVRKAIVRAIDAVADLDPAAGAHLRSCVHTGTRCRYQTK